MIGKSKKNVFVKLKYCLKRREVKSKIRTSGELFC